jgi:hypothetical protein
MLGVSRRFLNGNNVRRWNSGGGRWRGTARSRIDAVKPRAGFDSTATSGSRTSRFGYPRTFFEKLWRYDQVVFESVVRHS